MEGSFGTLFSVSSSASVLECDNFFFGLFGIPLKCCGAFRGDVINDNFFASKDLNGNTLFSGFTGDSLPGRTLIFVGVVAGEFLSKTLVLIPSFSFALGLLFSSLSSLNCNATLCGVVDLLWVDVEVTDFKGDGFGDFTCFNGDFEIFLSSFG